MGYLSSSWWIRALYLPISSDHLVHGPSQWETTLHCNVGWAHTQNNPCTTQLLLYWYCGNNVIAKYEWICSNKNEYDWLVLNINKTKAENDKDSGSLLHGMVAHNTTIRITVIQIFSATDSVAYRVDISELRSKHIGWNATDIIKLRFVINNMISFPSGPDFGCLNTILVYRRE